MDNYEDIINLPHHVSKSRRPMSPHQRAAQFAPFAALTGFEEAIEETGRFTDQKISLTDEEILEINYRLNYIKSHINEGVEITIEYFVADERKSGGKYLRTTDRIKKLNEPQKSLVLGSGKIICFEDILTLDINTNKETEQI